MSAERRAPPNPASSPPGKLASGLHAKFTQSDDELDLTTRQQERINEVFATLGSASLYDLLGVLPGADKKAVKGAYFERAAEFHPDRFFRLRLGSFKRKMEAIFTRMTDAQELLCSTKLRREYDAALRANRMNAVDALLEQAALEMAGEQFVREEAHFDPTIRVESSIPPPPSTQDEVQARRDALARRLLGGGPRRSTPPPKR